MSFLREPSSGTIYEDKRVSHRSVYVANIMPEIKAALERDPYAQIVCADGDLYIIYRSPNAFREDFLCEIQVLLEKTPRLVSRKTKKNTLH